MKTRPSSPGFSCFRSKETNLKAKPVHHTCRWTLSWSWEAWSSSPVTVTVKEAWVCLGGAGTRDGSETRDLRQETVTLSLTDPERSRTNRKSIRIHEDSEPGFVLVLSRHQTGWTELLDLPAASAGRCLDDGPVSAEGVSGSTFLSSTS